jgi:hypothetical protein
MSLLSRIVETLDAAGIRHAMIGALALAAYGVNRATVDVDLLVADASCLEPSSGLTCGARALPSRSGREI